MKDLKSLRNAINTIDDEIMALFEQRFTLVKTIGSLKQSNMVPVEDNSRENEILNKVSTFDYKSEIKTIYNTVFTVSKNLQRK